MGTCWPYGFGPSIRSPPGSHTLPHVGAIDGELDFRFLLAQSKAKAPIFQGLIEEGDELVHVAVEFKALGSDDLKSRILGGHYATQLLAALGTIVTDGGCFRKAARGKADDVGHVPSGGSKECGGAQEFEK